MLKRKQMIKNPVSFIIAGFFIGFAAASLLHLTTIQGARVAERAAFARTDACLAVAESCVAWNQQIIKELQLLCENKGTIRVQVCR